MKDSIAYRQSFCLNKICYNNSDLEKNCQKLLKTLTNRDYDKTETMNHINKDIAIPRNEILIKNLTENKEKTPLIATFSRTLADLRLMINKNWHILQTDPKLKEMFKNSLLLPLKETKISVTLLEVINFTLIEN